MNEKFHFKFNIKTRNLYYQDKLIGQLNAVEGRILKALINSSTTFMERDHLLDIAWPDKDVTPNSLNVAIKKIRARFFYVAEKEAIITHFKKGFSWNHQYIQCELYDVDAELSDNQEIPKSFGASGLVVSPAVQNEIVHEKPLSRVLSSLTSATANVPKISTVKKPLKVVWFSMGYYLLCVAMVLFISWHILFYTTQVTLMSCQHIKGSKFCGYGSLIKEDIPLMLPPGNYIYVNSQSNGFQYAEVK